MQCPLLATVAVTIWLPNNINCHLVRKLAAARESKLNSVNVIPPRQGRRPESTTESAGAAKDVQLLLLRTFHSGNGVHT